MTKDGQLQKDFVNGLTDQLYLSFGIEWDTIHLVGYQRMGAANPLVGGVAQQALALPIPVG